MGCTLCTSICNNGSTRRRKRYDETGSLEDSERLSGQDFDSLYEFYRSVYKKVALPFCFTPHK